MAATPAADILAVTSCIPAVLQPAFHILSVPAGHPAALPVYVHLKIQSMPHPLLIRSGSPSSLKNRNAKSEQ